MKTKPTDIVLYKSKDGTVTLDVQFEKETIWLDAHKMAELFGRDRSVILKHIHNIYNTRELPRQSTCAKNAQVAADGKVRQMDIFNLDVIISVGYRVNSKRGTEFRIWATNVLKQHLVQGYSVNEKRLKALKQTLKLASDISKRKILSGDEATALLQIVSEYSYALDLLDDYDHQRVAVRKISRRKTKPITYDEVKELIAQMRTYYGDSDLFGKEKDQGLHGSLNAVMQSFDGKDVYPSRDHSRAFYDLLSSKLPQWQRLKAELELRLLG